MIGITAYGAYIPRRRLQRKAIAQANAWFAPGLVGGAKGERAMANWDEDAVTMAVEAGRDCLPATDPRQGPRLHRCVYFASTTMPFADRQNAGIVAARARPSRRHFVRRYHVVAAGRHFGFDRGAGRGAAGRAKSPLLVAGEKRKARAASAQELAYGDAAAALTLGKDKVIAKFVGSHSVYRRLRRSFPRRRRRVRLWLGRALDPRRGLHQDRAGGGQSISGKDRRQRPPTSRISSCRVRLRNSTRRLPKHAASIRAKVRDNLAANVGDAGAAHALLMLVHALEAGQARRQDTGGAIRPGLRCAALRSHARDRGTSQARSGVTGSLARRKEETNYIKFLAFNGLIELEKGMRAEVDKRTALTVLYRKNDMLLG